MKIGFVELDETIVVRVNIQADMPGSIRVTFAEAGFSTLDEGELPLKEGEGAFSISEGWFSKPLVTLLHPGAGRFRLTDRRLSIIRPVTESTIAADTGKDPLRRSLLMEAIRTGRSEYAEIYLEEIVGCLGNRLLLYSPNLAKNAQLEIDIPGGPGPIVDNIPNIKRFTQDELMKELTPVVTGRHKQIGTFKHDVVTVIFLLLAGFFSPAWMVETGLIEARIMSVAFLVPAIVVFAHRLTIPHGLRVDENGVTLFTYLGKRHLQYADIDRFTSETGYGERYEQDSLSDGSVMVVKPFSGIRINRRGGRELFVACDPGVATKAQAYFLEMAPAGTRRDVACAETTEADRRRLQDMAVRLPKKIWNANAINAAIGATTFILVLWITVQLLPDTDVNGKPETILSKILVGCLVGAFLFGFEFLLFGIFYRNHALFQIEHLIGEVDSYNNTVRGPRLEIDIIALRKLNRLTLRIGMAGLAFIGIPMLIARVVSFWNPSVEPGSGFGLGFTGFIITGIGIYGVIKF
jgi:hypothetical protein